GLDGLENGGSALAHAAADGGEPEPPAAPAQLERGGADEARPGCSYRVTQRAGSSVRVHVGIVRDVELAHERDRCTREGLVHLDHGHVARAEPGALEGARRGGGRGGDEVGRRAGAGRGGAGAPVAMVWMRASGARPRRVASALDMSRHTAAPSAWPEEVAAVILPSAR